MRGLYALKPWYARRLSFVTRYAVDHGISPDVFTWAGVAAGLAAGVTVAQGWAWLSAALLAMRLAGANLDGAVARARGVSRPWGMVLNELGDRVADLAAMVGLLVFAVRTSPVGGGSVPVTSVPITSVLVLAAVAAVASTLPTWASLAAAGAGATRYNGGPVGKTERCALVVLALLFPAWLVWVLTVIIVGSVLTAGLRLRRAHRELSGLQEPPVAAAVEASETSAEAVA